MLYLCHLAVVELSKKNKNLKFVKLNKMSLNIGRRETKFVAIVRGKKKNFFLCANLSRVVC